MLIATAPAPAQPPAGDSRSSLYLATDTMDHSRLRDRGQAEETTRQTPLQLHEWAMIIAGLTLITLLLHSRHRKIMNDCENIF